MIDKWFKYTTPEEILWSPEEETYLVKLANNESIKASRSNGHWFGMWRWLRDEEVEGWAVL